MWRHGGGRVVIVGRGGGREHGVVRMKVLLRRKDRHVQMVERRVSRSAKGAAAPRARVPAVVGPGSRDATKSGPRTRPAQGQGRLEIEDGRGGIRVEKVWRGLE